MKLNERPNNGTQGQEAKQMYVGLESMEVMCINPTTEEINKMYGRESKEDDKEQEYITEREGIDNIRITVFLKALQTNRIVRKTFFIEDKERMDKTGTKYQYLNQTGDSGWGQSEDDLMDFFKNFTDKDKKVIGKKAIRKAKNGEADFYEFVKGVLRKVNYYDPTTDVTFDFKKMLKGNWKELNQHLTGELAMPISLMNYIKNVETENGIKTYNEVWTDKILNGDMYSKIEFATSKYYKETCQQIQEDEEEFKRLKINGVIETITPQDIYGYVNTPDIKFKSEWDNKAWNKYCNEINGGYGCKGFYKLSPVFEYHPSMDISSTNNVIAPNDLSY